MTTLTSLPYHQRITNLLKQQAKTWSFFSLPQNKEKQLAKLKIDLLKSTYKFDAVTYAQLYEKVNKAKQKLALDVSVTLYQAENADDLNASIVYLHGEAHIIFSGPILKLLDSDELQAVLAHELTHIKLFSMQDGELETADRIITAIAYNSHQDASYFETARLFKLYTEIFCDRGAYLVTGSMAPIISSLVKIATGLEQVDADNYLQQANEIYTHAEAVGTEQISHPENFIRARALDLWVKDPTSAEQFISDMIEGRPTLDNLDLFQQSTLQELTHKILQLFLRPNWFQTEMVLGLAKQYFPGFKIDDSISVDRSLVEQINKYHSSIKEYISYILLDFAWVDTALEQAPLGWALQLTEELGLKETANVIFKKESQVNDKKWAAKKQEVLEAFRAVK